MASKLAEAVNEWREYGERRVAERDDLRRKLDSVEHDLAFAHECTIPDIGAKLDRMIEAATIIERHIENAKVAEARRTVLGEMVERPELEVCRWQWNGDYWGGDCGAGAEWAYCPKCGKPLEIVEEATDGE